MENNNDLATRDYDAVGLTNREIRELNGLGSRLAISNILSANKSMISGRGDCGMLTSFKDRIDAHRETAYIAKYSELARVKAMGIPSNLLDLEHGRFWINYCSLYQRVTYAMTGYATYSMEGPDPKIDCVAFANVLVRDAFGLKFTNEGTWATYERLKSYAIPWEEGMNKPGSLIFFGVDPSRHEHRTGTAPNPYGHVGVVVEQGVYIHTCTQQAWGTAKWPGRVVSGKNTSTITLGGDPTFMFPKLKEYPAKYHSYAPAICIDLCRLNEDISYGHHKTLNPAQDVTYNAVRKNSGLSIPGADEEAKARAVKVSKKPIVETNHAEQPVETPEGQNAQTVLVSTSASVIGTKVSEIEFLSQLSCDHYLRLHYTNPRVSMYFSGRPWAFNRDAHAFFCFSSMCFELYGKKRSGIPIGSKHEYIYHRKVDDSSLAKVLADECCLINQLFANHIIKQFGIEFFYDRAKSLTESKTIMLSVSEGAEKLGGYINGNEELAHLLSIYCRLNTQMCRLLGLLGNDGDEYAIIFGRHVVMPVKKVIQGEVTYFMRAYYLKYDVLNTARGYSHDDFVMKVAVKMSALKIVKKELRITTSLHNAIGRSLDPKKHGSLLMLLEALTNPNTGVQLSGTSMYNQAVFSPLEFMKYALNEYKSWIPQNRYTGAAPLLELASFMGQGLIDSVIKKWNFPRSSKDLKWMIAPTTFVTNYDSCKLYNSSIPSVLLTVADVEFYEYYSCLNHDLDSYLDKTQGIHGVLKNSDSRDSNDSQKYYSLSNFGSNHNYKYISIL